LRQAAQPRNEIGQEQGHPEERDKGKNDGHADANARSDAGGNVDGCMVEGKHTPHDRQTKLQKENVTNATEPAAGCGRAGVRHADRGDDPNDSKETYYEQDHPNRCH